VRRFVALLLALSAAASVDGVLQYSGLIAPYSGVVTPSGITTEAFSATFSLENNLAQARFYGSGALIAFVAWLYASPFSKRGVALIAVFAICFCGLLITGGRGPTLAALAAMMLPLALGLSFVGRRLFASKALVATFVLLAVLIVALLQGASEFSDNLRTLQRLGVLFTEEEGGGTAAARIDRWVLSWQFWLKQPLFGGGVGSWPILFNGLDEVNYPHNLILEVLVEFGLIGLLLLAAMAFPAVRRASVRRLRGDPVLMFHQYLPRCNDEQ
jgi:O-antigen ligase